MGSNISLQLRSIIQKGRESARGGQSAQSKSKRSIVETEELNKDGGDKASAGVAGSRGADSKQSRRPSIVNNLMDKLKIKLVEDPSVILKPRPD